jgi:hypothetical protein
MSDMKRFAKSIVPGHLSHVDYCRTPPPMKLFVMFVLESGRMERVLRLATNHMAEVTNALHHIQIQTVFGLVMDHTLIPKRIMTTTTTVMATDMATDMVTITDMATDTPTDGPTTTDLVTTTMATNMDPWCHPPGDIILILLCDVMPTTMAKNEEDRRNIRTRAINIITMITIIMVITVMGMTVITAIMDMVMGMSCHIAATLKSIAIM